MLRFICSPVLLLMAYTVLAAPAPEDSWDRVDPDHDCKFHIEDGKVTIELPGGDHDINPKRKRFNAPCLLREVEGDFLVQVASAPRFARPPNLV